MIITRHPYDLGDRIIVGNVKGDVIDITVMHTYLAERGGMEGGEERSGRIALLPNSVLFDENVINYSKDDDFVLDRVIFKVTYESDMDAAVGIALEAARKETASYNHKGKDAPFTRIAFSDSGVDVKVRYLVNFSHMQDVRDRVTRRVFKAVTASKKVNFAYPHVELVTSKGSRAKAGRSL
jgi:small-conductance mechanosensitive channel